MDAFHKEYEEILSKIPTSKVGRLFDELKNNLGSRPLVLYGAGRSTAAILDYCTKYSLPVECICDSAKTGVFSVGSALPIIDPHTLMLEYSQAKVIICSFTYDAEIYSNLLKIGFLPEQIVRYPAEHLYLETPQTFKQYLEGYRWAYNFFQDDVSRQTVLDRMRLYLLDTPILTNTSCTMYYEDGYISLSENEMYVDGGAYDGNTAEVFISKMQEAGKPYSRAYAFEPSPTNCEKARHRLSNYKNIEIVQKGLWSTEKELMFFENAENTGGASFVICGGSGQIVQTTSLDIFFTGIPDSELPTFIKMDIEGAEKEALIGASDIIRQKKPKLAICAYHKPEDVFKLPQTIMGMRDDYKFALRHHYDGAYDTVLYAV